MDYKLPAPTDTRRLFLDENGQWWHPEIEIVQAMPQFLLERRTIHKFDLALGWSDEDSWILISVEFRCGEWVGTCVRAKD